MKKTITVLLSVLCIFLTFAASSCTRTPPPNDTYIFSSDIIEQKENYVKGDSISILLLLTNRSRKKQTLTHKGDKPLYCAINCGEETEYCETDEKEKNSTFKTILPWIKSVECINKTVTFKFEKAGTYTIKTYSEFTEYDQNYRYDADDITITVSE